MNMLVPLAALLGLEVKAITGRIRQTLIAYAVMVVFGLIGLCFLLLATYLALADWLGTMPAALTCAATALVLAMVTFILIKVSTTRRQREQAEKRHAAETSAFVTTAATTALPALWKSPALRTIAMPAAAALAAFLLTRRGGNHPDH
ncbi:MAG: hypothetical protein JWR39_896 [Devosia sp.]|jgi:cytochrome bd-type quinol oxidase subunit 2|nr:hypothetical protein [Devosia sp.]